MKEKSKTILKTLGVSALALTGLFAFSGCATDITLTQEQADKTIESVQNLDANMQEMIEQNNAQNLKIEELVEQIKNQNEIIEEQSNSTTQNLDANMQEMIEQNNAQNLKIEELIEQIKKQNEIIEKQSNATTREQVVSKLQLATLRLMMNYNDIWDGLQIKSSAFGSYQRTITTINSEDGYIDVEVESDGTRAVRYNDIVDSNDGLRWIFDTNVSEETPKGVGTRFTENGDVEIYIAQEMMCFVNYQESKIEKDDIISFEEREDGTLIVDTFMEYLDSSTKQLVKFLRRYEISNDGRIVSLEINQLYINSGEETETYYEILLDAKLELTYNYEGINKEDYLQIVNDMKAKMPTV
ncbi:MAG: hypothetical protein ACI4L6_00585 [Candidatus Onthoplasma sp.]